MSRESIHKRIRARVKGTTERPRLSVFRSNAHIYAQLIDDNHGVTICSSSDLDIKKGKTSKSSIARAIGEDIAKKAKEKKIGSAVFDRGGFKYHGRIKEVAEGAREKGLKF
jgi:large subunit ribosomal protein L18